MFAPAGTSGVFESRDSETGRIRGGHSFSRTKLNFLASSYLLGYEMPRIGVCTSVA